LKEYVCCTVVSNLREELIMCQPNLLKTLERVVKDRLAGIRVYKTPAILEKIVVKITKEDEIMDKKSHRLFRSGVEMLLYFIKYSKPDIANSVREIAKVIDGPTKQHLKSLFRLIRYVLDT
jgi:hypothetical protein